jgi:hypothetical protein
MDVGGIYVFLRMRLKRRGLDVAESVVDVGGGIGRRV